MEIGENKGPGKGWCTAQCDDHMRILRSSESRKVLPKGVATGVVEGVETLATESQPDENEMSGIAGLTMAVLEEGGKREAKKNSGVENMCCLTCLVNRAYIA